MVEYTKDQIVSYQKLALFNLIPFVADFFAAKRVHHKQLIPPAKPELITQETLELLQPMLPRLLWYQLLARFGWRSKDFPSGDKIKTGYLWQACAAEFGFGFSDFAVELMTRVYNDTSISKEKTQEHVRQQLPVRTDGDTLLEFLVYLQWRESGRLTSAKREMLRDNFLCQLTEPHEFEPAGDEASWSTAIEKITWMLPWMNAFWVKQWIQIDAQRWRSREQFVLFDRRHITVKRRWFDYLLEGQYYAYLSVFLHFYQQWYSQFSLSVQSGLQRLAEDHSMRERQALLSELDGYFTLVRELARLQQELVALHPVDRDGHVNVFLAECGKTEFSSVASNWNGLHNDLRPVIQ